MSAVDISLIISAYLVGSLSSAIIVCKLMGLPDPRNEGSGNPGATNVLRIGGKKAAAITLAGDMLKGLLPVLAGQFMGLENLVLGLAGFAAFMGHLYPLFFRFQGGKGVATMLGVLLGLSWWAGLATAATWLFMAKVVKISSLSALVATLLAPGYIYLFTVDLQLVEITAFMTIILFWRHRSNIERLLSGEEGRISQKSD